jgi:hypothetical protein
LLDFVAEDDPAELLGQAHLAGWMLGRLRPVATYRLMIGAAELPGLFTCVGRQFKPVVA